MVSFSGENRYLWWVPKRRYLAVSPQGTLRYLICPVSVQQELLMAAEEREKSPEFIIWLFHVMVGYLQRNSLR